MPRALRIEYPGAIYHITNRGDRREPIFRDDLDHKKFLTTLAEACTKTDWQVHAYCLMNFELYATNQCTVRAKKTDWRWGRWASQARHKLVAPSLVVRFANRGLDYEPLCEGKLIYSN